MSLLRRVCHEFNELRRCAHGSDKVSSLSNMSLLHRVVHELRCVHMALDRVTSIN